MTMENATEDYLINKETLSRFIDELIRRHPIPIDNAEKLKEFRDEQMRALDDHIINTLFGNLDDAQLNSLDQLLNQEFENPDVFRKFFLDNNINVEQIIIDSVKSFNELYAKGV